MYKAWKNHHTGLKEERLNEWIKLKFDKMVAATEGNNTPAIEMEDRIPSVSINMEDVPAMPQNISTPDVVILLPYMPTTPRTSVRST